MQSGLLTAFVALGAGLLSFVSPCVLPLVPAYLGYITGLSAEELARGAGARRQQAVIAAGAFVLGLAAVFTLLGATASAAGQLLLSYQTLFTKLAGVLIILFGLQMAGVIRFDLLYREARLDFVAFRGRGYLGAFLMGAAFGVGWTPCIGTFLASVLLLASQSDTLAQGMALLFLYALGLGMPFVLAALAIDTAIGLMRRLKRRTRQLEIASGVLLVAMGLLVFTDRMTLLSAWFSRAFGNGLAI